MSLVVELEAKVKGPGPTRTKRRLLGAIAGPPLVRAVWGKGTVKGQVAVDLSGRDATSTGSSRAECLTEVEHAEECQGS